jgi:hypothetical protein
MMRKVVACLPMYACFWSGYATGLLLERIPDSEAKPVQWLSIGLHRFHYQCMRLSVVMNDWAGFALWKR